MVRLIFVRSATALLFGLSSAVVTAQSDERVRDAERRAVEAENRAAAAERRALESERRALETDRNAGAGSSQPPSRAEPAACQRATTRYEFICSAPSRDAIGDTPECAAAQAEMHRRCAG